MASTINNKMQWGPLHPHMWMKKELPFFIIYWLFWLNCCVHDNNNGVYVNDMYSISIFIIKLWIRDNILVFYLGHQWMFWAKFISVVLGSFVEIAPFFGVLRLPVTLLFLSLRLVFWNLFVRVIFLILWFFRIWRSKLPFVLVPKFLLDFNNISIRNTKWWDI